MHWDYKSIGPLDQCLKFVVVVLLMCLFVCFVLAPYLVMGPELCVLLLQICSIGTTISHCVICLQVSEEPDKTSEPPKEEEKPAADESAKPEAAADEPETPKAEGEEPAKEEGGAEVTVDVTAEAAEGEAKKDEPKAEG